MAEQHLQAASKAGRGSRGSTSLRDTCSPAGASTVSLRMSLTRGCSAPTSSSPAPMPCTLAAVRDGNGWHRLTMLSCKLARMLAKMCCSCAPTTSRVLCCASILSRRVCSSWQQSAHMSLQHHASKNSAQKFDPVSQAMIMQSKIYHQSCRIRLRDQSRSRGSWHYILIIVAEETACVKEGRQARQ